MNHQIVRFTVSLTIHEGKFEAFQATAKELIAGSRKEPGTLGYEWYLSADRKRCRVLETYADESAMLAHLTGPVVQSLVPKLLELVSVDGFEVYGTPGAKGTEMLGGWGAQMFAFWDGIKK